MPQDYSTNSMANHLVGKKVTLFWVDESNDWYWYIVLGIDLGLGWIHLQGTDSFDGDRYTGKPFWTSLKGISTIVVGLYEVTGDGVLIDTP